MLSALFWWEIDGGEVGLLELQVCLRTRLPSSSGRTDRCNLCKAQTEFCICYAKHRQYGCEQSKADAGKLTSSRKEKIGLQRGENGWSILQHITHAQIPWSWQEECYQSIFQVKNVFLIFMISHSFRHILVSFNSRYVRLEEHFLTFVFLLDFAAVLGLLSWFILTFSACLLVTRFGVSVKASEFVCVEAQLASIDRWTRVKICSWRVQIKGRNHISPSFGLGSNFASRKDGGHSMLQGTHQVRIHPRFIDQMKVEHVNGISYTQQSCLFESIKCIAECGSDTVKRTAPKAFNSPVSCWRPWNATTPTLNLFLCDCITYQSIFNTLVHFYSGYLILPWLLIDSKNSWRT